MITLTGVVAIVSAGGALAVAAPWFESSSAAAPAPASVEREPAPAPVPTPAPTPVAAPTAVPAAPRPCTSVSLGFAHASVTPPGDALATLAPVLEAARTNAEAAIVIDGHADPTGDEIGNLVLSKKRAHRVAALVLGTGIPQARVVERAFGAYMPSLEADGGPIRRVRVWLRDNQCGEEARP
jgi:outer membrane protein OmpA-like peptidoglycan-associated protein